MRVEPHFESGGFSALKPEWNDLLQRSCCNTLFLTWQWQTTWWKHLGDGDLLLLGFRHEGRLVGIAPLFYPADAKARLVQMIGCRDVSDYLDVIIEVGQEEAVYTALLDYLEQEAPPWDVIDLCNIPEQSRTFEQLRQMADARGYQTVVELEDVCPVITLPNTWEEYLQMLDKKQRHEVRRKLRRAEESDMRFEIVGRDDNLQAEMLKFIALHQKSAPEKDAFMEPRMQSFFLEIARVLQEQGWLQLSFVEVDNNEAAALLNFDYGEAILVYNSGYDPAAYSHLSPGIIVTARSIEQAITLGRKHFDFLRGDEEYKYRFGAQNSKVHRLIIAQPGVDIQEVC